MTIVGSELGPILPATTSSGRSAASRHPLHHRRPHRTQMIRIMIKINRRTPPPMYMVFSLICQLSGRCRHGSSNDDPSRNSPIRHDVALRRAERANVAHFYALAPTHQHERADHIPGPSARGRGGAGALPGHPRNQRPERGGAPSPATRAMA